MLLLAGPLLVLYLGAGLVMKLIEKSRARNRPDWAGVADDQASAL